MADDVRGGGNSTMVTAAVCVIGNEILSGRVQDANVAMIALGLNEVGVQLREVRVVPDLEEEICAAVNALRERYDYVFTTGGIGPTHDDITADSIGAAFGRAVDHHPVAYAKMEAWYAETGREFTDARKRMALAPEGAELIENGMTIAPGFRIENVFVLAGVPQVARAMFEAARPHLRHGLRVRSRSIATRLVEGILAAPLSAIQDANPGSDIGSYPVFGPNGGNGVTLVVRSTAESDLDTAGDAIVAMIAELGGEVLSDERT